MRELNQNEKARWETGVKQVERLCAEADAVARQETSREEIARRLSRILRVFDTLSRGLEDIGPLPVFGILARLRSDIAQLPIQPPAQMLAFMERLKGAHLEIIA